MKLYFFPVAPNPTKVRLFLAEKAEAGHPIELEQVLVNLREGEQKSPEHLARHPLGKLPVLELEDGRCFTESLAIIEYLEELQPEPSLCGATPVERMKIREVERQCDIGVLLPVAAIVHATRSPLGAPANPAVAEHFRGLLPMALAVLNDKLSAAGPFLAGEHPSIADCTLAAALQFARMGEVEIDAGFEHLHRWDADYRGRPAAKSVLVL